VRVTTAFNRLLALPGITVREVSSEPARITVTVALRRRRLACADCSHSSRARDDTRTVDSSWRHLDLGRLRLVVRARLRRIDCPTHGVRTEGVPLARVESGCTRDVEDLVAWLTTWCGARKARTPPPWTGSSPSWAPTAQPSLPPSAAWRAYGLKEALRAVFAGDLTPSETTELLDRWCVRAARSRLEPFVELTGTVRTHREGILAAIRLGINNARVEALNN
jgi:transposase